MAAPSYVPNTLDEQPRKGLPIPPSRAWRADRPGEARVELPVGDGFGVPGPDQGYALKLVRKFIDRLEVEAPTFPASTALTAGANCQRCVGVVKTSMNSSRLDGSTSYVPARMNIGVLFRFGYGSGRKLVPPA